MAEHDATTHVCVAADSQGKRYTEHAFSENGDPWRGATILTRGVISRLRERGELPLRDLTPTPLHEAAHTSRVAEGAALHEEAAR